MSSRFGLSGIHSPAWAPVSKFVPRNSCGACAQGIVKIVSPKQWPVGTVAETCYACGRVLRYADNLLLFTPREAFQEAQKTKWVVRRGSARQPSNQEAARAMILMGAEMGLSFTEISAELDIDEKYVQSVVSA